MGWRAGDELRGAEQGKTGMSLLCQGRKLTFFSLVVERDRVQLYFLLDFVERNYGTETR